MNPFEAPPATDFTFLSLGAGVQSSTIALMAAHGEITPMPDAAIFADTQAEPASVYKWLDWLEPKLPFPVHRVTRGDMTAESLIIKQRKDGTGCWSKNLVPAFIENADGSRGLMGRQCTFNYKVEQLEKASRRLAGIKRGQKQITATQWIGISWDEIQRVKPARMPWVQHRWPLIELRMGRRDCLKWMERHGYPKPPRSACVYCPFHSDGEWRKLRDEEPKEFARAVQFEKDLQATKAKTDRRRGVPFLHPSCVPLDQVDLSTDIERGQLALWLDEQSFGNECEGMCGV
jgi:hypothetical protein